MQYGNIWVLDKVKAIYFTTYKLREYVSTSEWHYAHIRCIISDSKIFESNFGFLIAIFIWISYSYAGV